MSAVCLWQVGATGHLPGWLITLLVALLLAQTALAWRRISSHRHIAYDNNVWTLSSVLDGSRRSGTLLHAHYRSSWLLVLVFETDDGKRFTEEFWRDAVSAFVFSQLSFAALYGARPAIGSRTLRYTRRSAALAGQPTVSNSGDTPWRQRRSRGNRAKRARWSLP